MMSLPDGTGDIADAMISASQMIYALRMKGTDIIMSEANNKVLTKSGSYFTFCGSRKFYNPQDYFIFSAKKIFH